MNLFILSKHQSLEENVLFTSKKLYELLESKTHVDMLFTNYANKEGLNLSLNLERILYLSLTFLFYLGQITINNNMVARLAK